MAVIWAMEPHEVDVALKSERAFDEQANVEVDEAKQQHQEEIASITVDENVIQAIALNNEVTKLLGGQRAGQAVPIWSYARHDSGNRPSWAGSLVSVLLRNEMKCSLTISRLLGVLLMVLKAIS